MNVSDVLKDVLIVSKENVSNVFQDSTSTSMIMICCSVLKNVCSLVLNVIMMEFVMNVSQDMHHLMVNVDQI